MATASEYIAANDNAADYATSKVEAINQQALEDIDDLIHRVEGRDSELWDYLDVDSELTVSNFENEERDERGIDWTLGFSSITAASTMQFFLDNRITKPVYVN